MAGVALAVHPADQTRSGIAVWVASKAIEYAFNLVEARGLLGERPWVCDAVVPLNMWKDLLLNEHGDSGLVVGYFTHWLPRSSSMH